jgi:hypothetical protein
MLINIIEVFNRLRANMYLLTVLPFALLIQDVVNSESDAKQALN